MVRNAEPRSFVNGSVTKMDLRYGKLDESKGHGTISLFQAIFCELRGAWNLLFCPARRFWSLRIYGNLTEA